ncbi:neurogenic locus notch homolog protein 1 [Bacillus rossius redtenbacheri]|uniref:neurogenic locus notch homolog protein 1 n=1 Tax=Bacillus rossius redtenbacheri TaxID=93214 RepID=UPI002FDD0E42
MSNHRLLWCLAITFSSFMFSQGMPYACDQASRVCGRNTQCDVVQGRPVCSCLPGHYGNPISGCQKGECETSRDCPSRKSCEDNYCVNPCSRGPCGRNAQCDSANHVPVCSCPARTTGDPFTQCSPVDPRTYCSPSPCGQNAKCDVIRDTPTCSCPEGYLGDPLTRCYPECQSDRECSDHQYCSGVRCSPACSEGTCGAGAYCEARDHKAVCKCPEGHVGNALLSCRPECETSRDCPAHRPACLYSRCADPCEGACGLNAQCELQGSKAVCSCPRNMTGHPFEYCRPFDTRDLCEPNPCGRNAQCQPGYDKTGRDRPVCTCLAGYVGNGVVGCVRGECSSDLDCGDGRACYDSRCEDPCRGACGAGATCEARRHQAVCACPPGHTGNPLLSCSPLASGRYRLIRY